MEMNVGTDVMRGLVQRKILSCSTFRLIWRSASVLSFQLVLAVVAVVVTYSTHAVAESASTGFTLEVHKELNVSTPGAAVAVAWSSDGSRFAAASDYGSVLTVWDKSGHPINQMKRSGGGPTLDGSLAFAHESSQLLFPPPEGAPFDAALSIWDIASGNIVSIVSGPQHGLTSAPNPADHFQMTADQTTLIMATRRRGPNFMVYRTSDWKALQLLSVKNPFSLSVFDHDKSVALGLGDGDVMIVDIDSGTPLKKYLHTYDQSKFGRFATGAIAGSPDGSLLCVGVGISGLSGEYSKSDEAIEWLDNLEPVRVSRVTDGMRVASLSGPVTPIRYAAWDPKGRYVAFVDNSPTLYVWEPLNSGTNYRKFSLHGVSLSIAISPDGSEIAAATNTGVSVFSIY